ncbi:MAG TPA: hypothetical protein VK824_03230 [Planctomycetota bacterium]|nr:hypothetical protein [Planctomycetota bacterium]
MDQVLEFVGRYGSSVVFVLVFLDPLGLPIPTVPILLRWVAEQHAAGQRALTCSERLAMMRGMRLSLPCAVMSLTMGCNEDVPFEPMTWRSADAADRGRMCDDLLAHHHLVGMSLAQVITLLGAPDSNGEYISYGGHDGPGDPVASGALLIFFEEGLVTRFDRDVFPGPEPRPAALPFDRGRWLEAPQKERLAMLDGAVSLEPEFFGRQRVEVEDFFGASSFDKHDVLYLLGRGADFGFFGSQRMLLLDIDTDGLVVSARDFGVAD